MKSKITICMGSTCFSRGNRENLELIKAYLPMHGVDAQVDLAGCRCEGQCTKGPVIRIGDRMFCGVDRGMMIDLLNQYLGNLKEGAHGTPVSSIYGRGGMPGLPQVSPTLSGQGDRVRTGAGFNCP